MTGPIPARDGDSLPAIDVRYLRVDYGDFVAQTDAVVGEMFDDKALDGVVAPGDVQASRSAGRRAVKDDDGTAGKARLVGRHGGGP